MEIKYINFNNKTIAELKSDLIEIHQPQDALEIMMNCLYNGADVLIMYEHNLHTDFFDLKSGLAGEILQKFSTYQAKLAIVGDFSKYQSKSLRDFIYESNKIGRINFVASKEEALKSMTK